MGVKEQCKYFSDQKKYADRCGMKCLSNTDLEVCNYVLNQ